MGDCLKLGLVVLDVGSEAPVWMLLELGLWVRFLLSEFLLYMDREKNKLTTMKLTGFWPT
jgi:hypothetical protein